MSDLTPGELGAELAELYKKGKTTLPEVATQIGNADNAINRIAVYGALSRDGSLGLGATGCYSEFDAHRTALTGHLNTLQQQLDDCGVNIVKTARDMADVDHATAQAFTAHGGEFPA